jgi:hypothetical protein
MSNIPSSWLDTVGQSRGLRVGLTVVAAFAGVVAVVAAIYWCCREIRRRWELANRQRRVHPVNAQVLDEAVALPAPPA